MTTISEFGGCLPRPRLTTRGVGADGDPVVAPFAAAAPAGDAAAHAAGAAAGVAVGARAPCVAVIRASP